MADRGRDLKVSILSDVDDFTTDKPARDLEDLARKSDATKRDLDALDDAARAAGRSVDDLGRDADGAVRDVESIGTEARDTARKVDDAFDRIARSSKASANKVDTESRDIKGSLQEVGAEGQDTAREMFASWSGSFEDIAGAGQELAANAGGMFGPVGLAIGGALSAGIAIFTAKMEEIKQKTEELVGSLIEGGGRLDQESVFAKVREFAESGRIEAIGNQARLAGVNADDFALALAGDAEAMERVNAQLTTAETRLAATTAKSGELTTAQYGQGKALASVREELANTSTAVSTARRRYEDYRDATNRAGDAAVTAADNSGAAWDDLRSNLGRPIVAKVDVDTSDALAQAVEARRQVQAYMTRNPVSVNVNPRPGQGAGYGVVRPRP